MKEGKRLKAAGREDKELTAGSKKKAKVNWVTWGAIAAGIILIACAVSYFIVNYMNTDNANTAGGPANITVNSVTYYNSWQSEQTCKDGFEYAGIINAVSGDGGDMVLNCKYYANAEIPEWIYVYTNLMSGFSNSSAVNEYPDSTAMSANKNDMAYVRFVTAEPLYKRCIFYNDQLYQSMTSYAAAEENNDSLWNSFNELKSRYGTRTETLPEVCVLVGSAHIEEAERIPRTELGVNFAEYDNSAVYADPNDSQVLYVGTSWHTATEEEKTETLHNGYDVFVLYNPGKLK